MAKTKILRTDKYLFILERFLPQLLKVADIVTAEDDREETIAGLAHDAEIILTCYDPVSTKVINAAPKLKGIVKYGVGVNNIDLVTATKRGILVANCPAYGTDTVAEHAFALMIDVAKKLPKVRNVMERNFWQWPVPEFLGVELHGKTVGLVGFGKIGRSVSRKTNGFGMKTVAYDPYVDDSVFREYGVTRVGLDELIKISDFISIHCVLTPETQGLIGETLIRKMKKNVIVVNVSRAGVIDEKPLIQALKEGRIAGAGFDVFHAEPLNKDYPLLHMENVTLTPHFAWYTEEAFERCEQQTLQSLTDIIEGRIPKNLKNTDVLEKLSSRI